APASRALRTRCSSSTHRVTDNPVGRAGAGRARAKSPCSCEPFGPLTTVPAKGRAPSRSSCSTTPRRSSNRTASGLRYSAQGLSRGNAARSITTTLSPWRARNAAVALPAGPAPMTSTSVTSSCMSAHPRKLVRVEPENVRAREAVLQAESDSGSDARVCHGDRGRARGPGARAIAAVLDTVSNGQECLQTGTIRVEPPRDGLDGTRKEAAHHALPGADQGGGLRRLRRR